MTSLEFGTATAQEMHETHYLRRLETHEKQEDRRDNGGKAIRRLRELQLPRPGVGGGLLSE